MKVFKKVFIIIMAMLVTSVAPASTYALTESQLDFYAQNNILFYDPSAAGCAPGTIGGNKVTIIGDSISVGAKSEYESQIANADLEAKTYNGVTYSIIQSSKHFGTDAGDNYSGMTIAKEMQENGDLRPYLVFALGTNDAGAVTETAISSLMDLVGTNHKVVLVTNYAMENKLDFSSNNAAIKAAAEKYSGKVAVADWAAAVAGDPSKYIGDNYVHPNATGSKLFVQLIKKALNSLAGGSNGVSTGNNRNYAGATVWSEAELQAIETNQPIYEEAASKYNFPWPVMAVLHSHETGLRRYNPDNGQGVYQLYSYTDGGTNANRFEPASEISEEEFRRQTLIAAEIVSGMVGDLNNPDNVKRLFFQYNGTAQVYIDKAIAMGFSEEQAKNGEGSAYVMNRYDAQRDPTSSSMSPLWPGRFVADGVYDENSTSNGFGAFVQYEALEGSSYCSSAGGTIVDTAILLSWEGHGHTITDPKPEYVTAMKEVGAWIKPCGSNGECPYYGASCDQFVATVMRYSGVDPDFPIFHGSYSNGDGSGQNHYMDDHPEMYQRIENLGNSSNLQPGDIFVVNNDNTGDYHILLYIGEIDGQDSQASASWGGRTGEHFAGVPYSDYNLEYAIYRRINF